MYLQKKCHLTLTNDLNLHNFLIIIESGSLSYWIQHTKLYIWGKSHALIIFWKLPLISAAKQLDYLSKGEYRVSLVAPRTQPEDCDPGSDPPASGSREVLQTQTTRPRLTRWLCGHLLRGYSAVRLEWHGSLRQREHRCRTPRTSGSVVPVRQHE